MIVLIIREKEQLVLPDRAAHRAAEHIVTDRRPLRSLPVRIPAVRVQLVVAQEFERRSVELIRAGLDGHIDDAALEVTELRRRVVRDHLEFLNGVHVGLIGHHVGILIVVIDPVEQEVVRLFAFPLT